MTRSGAPRRWGRTPTGLYVCTDCPKELKSRSAMYRHWQRQHSSREKPEKNVDLCQFSDCGEDRIAPFPMCESHLLQQESRAREKLGERISVSGVDQCLNWTGAVTQRGYGNFHAYGLYFGNRERVIGAHVLSLYLQNREDPTNAMFSVPLHHYGHVHHSCENRGCVNPEHLTEISNEMHRVLHQMGNPRVLAVILNHIEETYPTSSAEVHELRSVVFTDWPREER